MGRKFTKIDESFVCEHCGKQVEELKVSCRNHCNSCLYSKHVDINPGDRNETCHGLLEPIKVELNSKKGYVIIYRCQKCGMIRRNKAAEDDNKELLIKLTAEI
ncbi:MAG: RNHCP domain-containing protein [Clostridia bacterium]|nr:RNHCP domain-containing protein [Clostridia bacterium]